jgi:hypothetical protein
MFILDSILVFFALPFFMYSFAIIAFLCIALSLDSPYEGAGWGWATMGSIALVTTIAPTYGITFETIKQAPMLLAIGLVAYLITGVVWAIAKWYFRLDRIREQYILIKNRFVDENKITGTFPFLVNDEQRQPWEEIMTLEQAQDKNATFAANVFSNLRAYGSGTQQRQASDQQSIVRLIKPNASVHKSTITQWIAFWPVSFVWTMINDPLRNLVNYIFGRIKGVFQRIADSMFSNLA